MKPKFHITLIVWLLVGAALACNMPATSLSTAIPPTQTSEPTATAAPTTPAPTVTLTSPPAASGIAVALQPCTLILPEEAEQIMGEAAAAPQEINGACAFSNARDGLYMVSVNATQAEQTEGLLQGQAILLGIAGVPLDQAKLEQLKSLASQQDFRAYFTELVALAQGAPNVKAQLVEGLGDVGYWAWLDAQSRRQGALVVGRGDTLVNVNLVVPADKAEQAMLEAAQALAEKIFTRLPARFFIAFNTPTPTIPPSPTMPPIVDTPIPPTPTWIAPDPNAPPLGYFEQPSYAGDCKQRPANSICLAYDDGYIWLISPWNDAVMGWGLVGSWQGKTIQVAFGQHADYYHILDTNLVMQVSK